MKKKIDLNFSITDLDGIELQNSNAGKILGNNLIGQTKGDALKYWSWALDLNQHKELELDESDFIHLKEFVKNNETLPVITKAQILKRFE